MSITYGEYKSKLPSDIIITSVVDTEDDYSTIYLYDNKGIKFVISTEDLAPDFKKAHVQIWKVLDNMMIEISKDNMNIVI